MSVKIRLKRMGSKKRPFYRIVVADSRSPRDGRFITTLGTYNPLTTPKEVKFDEDAVMDWLQAGKEQLKNLKGNPFKKKWLKRLFQEVVVNSHD